MENEVHLGDKVRTIRRMRGIKQQTLAIGLGIVQQNVSKMEKKKDIPEEKLKRAAELLGISVDELKNFDDKGLVNNNFGDQRDFFDVVHCNEVHYNINPVEKITSLYEELLKAKQEVLDAKEVALQAKDALIQELQKKK